MYNKYSQIDAAFQYITEHRRPENLVDIYEFGCYTGGSLKKIANYARLMKRYVALYGFDSFEGLGTEAKGLEVFEKFKEGSYIFPVELGDPIKWITNEVKYDDLEIFKIRFDELKKLPMWIKADFRHALLVHIDCDLYSPTVDALEFMFHNQLIQPGTLIAYDEFRSTKELAGEERAHKIVMAKYYAEADMIWSYQYKDKTTNKKILQAVFEVTNVNYE